MFWLGNKKKSRGGALSTSPQESPSLVHRKQRLQRMVIVGAFTALVVSITEFRLLRDPESRYDLDAEVVASQTVKAAFAFESENLEATREKREKEAAQVPATYTIDTERISNQLLTLQQRITTIKDRRVEVDGAIRDALLQSTSSQSEEEIVSSVITTLTNTWKEDPLFEGFPEAEYLQDWIEPDMETMPKRVFSPSAQADDPEKAVPRTVSELTGSSEEPLQFANIEPLTELSLEGLRYVLTEGVRQRPTGEREAGDGPARIEIIRPTIVGDLKEGEKLLLDSVPSPLDARPRLRKRIENLAQSMHEQETIPLDWERVASAAFELAKSSITDTLVYDQVVTEGRRELKRSSVEAVVERFEANQILQEEGYRWTDQARHDVKTYWSLLEGGDQRTRNILGPILSNMMLVGLLLLAFSQALPVVVSKKSGIYTAVNVAMLVTCGTLILGRVVLSFELSGLLVPLAASAMLLTILTNPRLASISTVLMTVLLSIQFRQDWHLLVVSGAMAFTGIVSLYTVRKRTDMARAALRAALIGLVTAIALSLASGTLFSWQTLQMLTLIALNGIVCMVIVPGLLSPLERLFGITTDFQLLEYSDLNNEILSRLAVEISATYAHSLMMGQLAEAAADAVEANGLMARVCAYYHDVGKLRRPEYFSENQTGYNIHEDLSPRLSARAIASHVTEGVEIAREFHLPQPIIRGILEHHGTLLISFFYQQALDQQKHGDVREEDFRYPGPKPQSPETAILMICDGVESGVRSIKNPNEERVREFISKIIQSRASDRQFDECDLTLKKLDIIGDVLTKRIMNTLHTRIAYPEKPITGDTNNVIQMTRRRE